MNHKAVCRTARLHRVCKKKKYIYVIPPLSPRRCRCRRRRRRHRRLPGGFLAKKIEFKFTPHPVAAIVVATVVVAAVVVVVAAAVVVVAVVAAAVVVAVAALVIAVAALIIVVAALVVVVASEVAFKQKKIKKKYFFEEKILKTFWQRLGRQHQK